MRKITALLAIFFAFTALGIVCAAKAAPATLLSPEITASDGGEVWMFCDNNRTTKRAFSDGGGLTLKHEAGEITGLYLIWDAPAPVGCIVEAKGLAPIKAQGFLHEWIDLSGSDGSQVTLTWQGKATLCDAAALGGADIPDWVQRWQPPQGDCDLLVLPTHADDEHLYLGGALATAANIPECAIQVAYMVNHNGEYYRPHELLNGLWAAGVERYPIIPEFPDIYSDSLAHAKTIYDEQQILAYQLSLIERFHPQVIVGHDLNGEYGHGAHMLNAHTLTAAVEQSAAQGVWDVPKLYLHLYEQNAIVLNLDLPLERFGGRTAFETAQLGFAAHKSQQTFFSVEQSGPYDCRKLGLYRSTVGFDSQNDIFENITLRANQPPPSPEPLADNENLAALASDESLDEAELKYLPQAKNDRLVIFIGSPLSLIFGAAALLAVLLFYIVYRNRRI